MKRRTLLEALAGCAAFCAISLAGFVAQPMVTGMVLAGFAIPIAWGLRTRGWAEMGLVRRDAGRALAWGLGAALVTTLLGLPVMGARAPAPDLGLELLVSVPLWLLLASPFQELFFRGWLQSRCERALGRGPGLLAATAAFTLWHYCWPLAEQSPIDLFAPAGVAVTAVAGLVYGYSFQRTGSMLAPWLAHALQGIALSLASGGFLQHLAAI